jgi:hypothetical protein
MKAGARALTQKELCANLFSFYVQAPAKAPLPDLLFCGFLFAGQGFQLCQITRAIPLM